MTSFPRATHLDHVAIVAPGALHEEFERLGFTLTPPTCGTPTRRAVFAAGSLELQAIPAPALPTNGYPGLHDMALGMDDPDGNLARLRRAGLDTPGLLTPEHPTLDHSVRLPLADTASGRWQLVHHPTPDPLRQPRLLDHPNRVTALDTLFMTDAEPARAAARLSAFAGWPVTPDPAGGFRLTLPRGTVRILPPDSLAAVLPGAAPPFLPFMAGIILRTADEAAAARALAPHGRPAPDGWSVPAGGAMLVFQ